MFSKYNEGGVYLMNNFELQIKQEAIKILNKCRDKDFCLRNIQGFIHYQISDRSDCPKVCPQNPSSDLFWMNLKLRENIN